MMKRVRGIAGVLALCGSIGLHGLPAEAQETVQFAVIDNLSPGQVEEVITVYLAGRNVGTLRVDANKRQDRLQITTARAERYEYALCGRLRMNDGGTVTEREINDGGYLQDVDGRTFAAYTDNAASFFLVDATPDREQAEVTRDNKPRCTAAIAAR